MKKQMKKQLFAIIVIVFGAWFVGCEKEMEPENGIAILKKAGTGYTVPNTFDADGNLCLVGGTYNTQVIGTPMELWMGVGNITAGTLIGYVTFLSGPDRVRIDLSDIDGEPGPDLYPYIVTKAHIHFGPDEADIPQTKKGNPIVGLFEYNIPVDPYQTVIEVPVEFDDVGAIHLSVVMYGGIEGFNFYLPNDPVTLELVEGPSGGPTYNKLKITDGGFISEYDMGYGPGVYEGWCIDIDHTIYPGIEYPSYLYSSYEELPEWMLGPGLIEYPENLDKVNYLVNHFEAGAGQMVPLLDENCDQVGLPQALTYGDIQRAIWYYIEDEQYPVPNWNQQRVNAIICDVDANGEGFVPGCDQKIVFLVVPIGDDVTVQIVIGQPVIASIPVPCEDIGGTAWGDGYFGANFPGSKQWGTWFLYDSYCVPLP